MRSWLLLGVGGGQNAIGSSARDPLEGATEIGDRLIADKLADHVDLILSSFQEPLCLGELTLCEVGRGGLTGLFFEQLPGIDRRNAKLCCKPIQIDLDLIMLMNVLQHLPPPPAVFCRLLCF